MNVNGSSVVCLWRNCRALRITVVVCVPLFLCGFFSPVLWTIGWRAVNSGRVTVGGITFAAPPGWAQASDTGGSRAACLWKFPWTVTDLSKYVPWVSIGPSPQSGPPDSATLELMNKRNADNGFEFVGVKDFPAVPRRSCLVYRHARIGIHVTCYFEGTPMSAQCDGSAEGIKGLYAMVGTAQFQMSSQ